MRIKCFELDLLIDELENDDSDYLEDEFDELEDDLENRDNINMRVTMNCMMMNTIV